MVFQTQAPISLVMLVIGIQDLYMSKYTVLLRIKLQDNAHTSIANFIQEAGVVMYVYMYMYMYMCIVKLDFVGVFTVLRSEKRTTELANRETA